MGATTQGCGVCWAATGCTRAPLPLRPSLSMTPTPICPPTLRPPLQIPYTVVFTKVDKRKKNCPPAEENIAAFQQVGSSVGARGLQGSPHGSWLPGHT